MNTLKTITIALVLCLGPITVAQESLQNPTATEDIKIVSDYIDALMTNKMDVVASLLSDNLVNSGPASGDTETKAELIATWTESNKIRSNQKNDFVSNSFRVVGGDLEGDWVSVWGTYSFTENGKDITLPYQFTAEIKDEKIQRSVIYYDRLAISEAMGYELTAKKN